MLIMTYFHGKLVMQPIMTHCFSLAAVPYTGCFKSSFRFFVRFYFRKKLLSVSKMLVTASFQCLILTYFAIFVISLKS